MALFVPIILIVLMVVIPFLVRRLIKGKEHPEQHYTERVLRRDDVLKNQNPQRNETFPPGETTHTP